MYFSPHRNPQKAVSRIHNKSNDFSNVLSDSDSLWSEEAEGEQDERMSSGNAMTPSEASDGEDTFIDRTVREYIKAQREAINSQLPAQKLSSSTSSSSKKSHTQVDEIDNLLNKWSISDISTSLPIGKETYEDKIKLYQERKEKELNQGIQHASDKYNDMFNKRKARIEKFARIQKEKEEEEKRRIEEAKRKEEERLRKLEEERQRQIKLLKEKQEAEAKREAEEKAAQEKAAAEALKQKQEAEEKAKKEAEAAAAAAAAAEIKAKKEAEEKAKSEKSSYSNWTDVNTQFAKYKKIIANVKSQIVVPVSENPQMKKNCFQAKRLVRTKLGQLTDSNQQLQKVFIDVVKIIDQFQRANQTLFHWILNCFSKLLVAQAEIETISNVETATPLARLAVMLMDKYEALKELLLARFVKKCPLVIGYTCTIDTEGGRERMGWKRKEGKYEDPNTYSERLSGICAVWVAMTISTGFDFGGRPHPYPVSNLWTFFARLANTPKDLITDVHYSVVGISWDISSQAIAEEFGRQGSKLLKLLSTEWVIVGKERKYPAALRVLLQGEEWMSSGKLKSLKPMER